MSWSDLPVPHVAVLDEMIHFVDGTVRLQIELPRFVHFYSPFAPSLLTPLFLRCTVSTDAIDTIDGRNVTAAGGLKARDSHDTAVSVLHRHNWVLISRML